MTSIPRRGSLVSGRRSRFNRWAFAQTVRVARAWCAVFGHRQPPVTHTEETMTATVEHTYCGRCFQAVPSTDGQR